MVACYAPDGTAHQKEPVDARECCEHCGYSMTPPESQPVSNADSEPTTVVALREWLILHGVEFPSAANKAELLALYEAAR